VKRLFKMKTKVYYGVPVSTHQMTLVSLHNLLIDNPNTHLFTVKLNDTSMVVKWCNNNNKHTINNIGFFIGFPQPEYDSDGFEDETLLGADMLLTTYELTFDESSHNKVCTSIRQVHAEMDYNNRDENNLPTLIYTYV